MSARLMQAVNQVRLTNVAVVRLKRYGKRFEIACYKNKVVNWRNGVETDIDEVLQIDSVFVNVSKGILAKSADLKKAFGTTEQVECCKCILKDGDLQVSDKERDLHLDNLYKDIATIVSAKSVNTETNRPYTVEAIVKAMKELIHYAVKANKPAKQQALEVIKLLKQKMPLDRAKMLVKVTFQTQTKVETEARFAMLKAKLESMKAAIDTEVRTETRIEVLCLIVPHCFRDMNQFVKQELQGSLEVKDISVQNTKVTNVEDLEPLSRASPSKVSAKSSSVDDATASLKSATLATTSTTATNEEGRQGAGQGNQSQDSKQGLADYKSDKYKCLTCQIGFAENRDEQRDHYRSELHRLNLKLKMKGMEILTREVVHLMSEEEKNNILYDFRAD